ncbi:hypothetical protein METBIDRAFT_30044 [Metschnikowia bicuspidata var. bicuspidata NRRL YB-4993]|uniref:Nucleoporin n=1 Tax=Metschnikowia bicuspidata var. bicuspidata NRRL YB-4993 TaxID=869754 RepID=A0A1A0HHX7_9ASCO|nr:hypothetical protein METBIDRAFT_30044 [Metschnikowia bicuspidata var. bicuspidata NRRL YB-4993]OBA23606.1 hypothetical protein METBIDRAFT_30044 [Metschnikowia bicuspidata var. bicuspidata NRRL YB-4993]
MSTHDTMLTWSLEAFLECYNSIKLHGTVSVSDRKALKNDLRNILLVPARNEKSRSALAAGEKGKTVAFQNGQEYTLNAAFVTTASNLASELNLDELSSAELLQEVSATNFAQGSSPVEAGILGFYQRYSYILNILGFLVSEKQLDLIYEGSISEILPQILQSFKQIYSLVSLQNDFIDKENATGDVNSLPFVNKITYAKEQLFELHDLLAQLLYSLFDNYIDVFGTYESYQSILTHINETVKSNSDSLLLHYFPALMRIITCLLEIKDVDVHKFHLSFVSILTSDFSKVSLNDEIDTSKSSLRPHELLLQLIFYISLVPWCKQSAARTQKFDFQNDILKYTEWLINYGTMEQLLCYSAESANIITEVTFDQSKLFDFRPLLQKSFPRLTPILFTYSRNEELQHVARTRSGYSNLLRLCDTLSLSLSPNMREALLAPIFHTFFCDFVNHSAIVLTSLRDNEEDFLLSSINRKQLESDPSFGDYEKIHGESGASKNSTNSKSDYGIDLDELATRAELERFYLAFAYTYSNRPSICEAFWAHDNGNVVGFISWGLSNNTSPLITATFCLLLGSLTYSGQNSSDKVWEILCNSGLLKKKDYSQISVDSIISSLSYYINALEESVLQNLRDQGKLNQEKHETIFSSGAPQSELDKTPVQLSEDSVVFIAGFMMLISMVVENLSSVAFKKAAFLHFYPIISSFLKLDNIVTSAKHSQPQGELCMAFLNDENRTALVNLVLNLLTKFAKSAEAEVKCKIWVLLDKWISHSVIENESMNPTCISEDTPSRLTFSTSTSGKNDIQKLKALHKGTSMKRGFDVNLTKISEVLNFVKLMENLLEKEEKIDEYPTFRIPFPADLGHKNRQKSSIGIWPYIEYLISEVFGRSSGLDSKKMKFDLQNLILKIIVSSLREVDWNFFDKAAQDILPDFAQHKDRFAISLLSSGETNILSLNNFTRLHHSFAIINYLFENHASATLFQIINTGSEEITTNLNYGSLVGLALETLKLLLKLQTSFIDKLSILKNFDGLQPNQGSSNGYGTSMSLMLSFSQLEYNNIYYPDTLGTKGVSNFYEMLLYHITSVVNVALYVGNSEELLVNLSIEILSLISRSPIFVSGTRKSLLQQNRLLNIFQSIDESKKIKFAFIQQLEASTLFLKPKLKILNFLIENLPLTNEITISHFLIGFDIKADKLLIRNSSNSDLLLRSLVEMLLETLPLISDVDYSQGYQNQITLGPATLSSLIMKILVRLCQNSNSSKITLQYLRQHDLFVKIVNTQPKIDDLTIWHKFRFNGDVQDAIQNSFLGDDGCRDTFFEFVCFRNSVLQYLSLELHDVGSRSRKDYYIGLLLDGSEFLDGTARILNFLDVLHYQFYNTGDYNITPFEKTFNLQPLALEVEARSSAHEKVTLLNKVTNLRCKIANNSLSGRDAMSEFKMQANKEASELEITLNNACFVQRMKAAHSKTLHAWVQIVQVLTTDEVTKKTNFIPQVLQVVLPKINHDFHEQDVLFAEELISLCLFLFDLLDENSQTKLLKADQTSLQGLFALFKTCVNGLLCSHSSAGLRSDLYLLINKFIHKGLETEELLNEIIVVLRSVDSKFFDVVCNDSVYSEGVSRITSLILLESLVHLSQKENSSFFMTALTKNNTLSLLVRSLKRADDVLAACGEAASSKRDSGMNLETLFYELTALKTTLFTFIRLGQSRSGASKLVENGIFATLRRLKFLAIDADLGLDFLVQESEESIGHDTIIKLALDVPLTIREKNRQGGEHMKTLSLYEVLTPIFQLVATIVLSLGPSFELGIIQVEELMKHSHSIVVGVMKRDSLIESKRIDPVSDAREEEMRLDMLQLVNLITLIYTVLSGTKGGET